MTSNRHKGTEKTSSTLIEPVKTILDSDSASKKINFKCGSLIDVDHGYLDDILKTNNSGSKRMQNDPQVFHT